MASATALLGGTKNERELYVKEVLMDGISSNASDMGKFLTDRLTGTGPHIPYLRLAALSKGPESRFGKTTGLINAGLQIINTRQGFNLAALIVEATGDAVGSTGTYSVGPEDIYWVVAKYVTLNYPEHATHDLWTFYVADNPEEEIYGEPIAGKTPIALKLIDLPEIAADGSFAEEPDLTLFTEFLIYVDNLAPNEYFYTEYNIVGDEKLSTILKDNDGTITEDMPSLSHNGEDYLLTSEGIAPVTFEEIKTVEHYKKVVVMVNDVPTDTWELESTETFVEEITGSEGTNHYELRVHLDLIHSDEHKAKVIKYYEKTEEVTEEEPDSETRIVTTQETYTAKYHTYVDIYKYYLPSYEIPQILIIPFSEVSHHFELETEVTKVMPIIPLRREKAWIYETHSKDNLVRRHIDFCTKKLLNQSLVDFSKELNQGFVDGDNLNKIDYVNIFFGVPLNIEDQHADTYLFEFFKATSQPQEVLDRFKSRLEAYNANAVEMEKVLQRLVPTYIGSGGFRRPAFRDPVTGQTYSAKNLPTSGEFPVLETKTSITLNNSNPTYKFKRRIEWLSFSEVIDGTPPIRNRLRTLKSNTHSTLVRKFVNFGKSAGDVQVKTIPAVPDQFTLTRAISANQYEVITVIGLTTTTYEKWDKTTTEGSSGSFSDELDEGECVNVIPVVPRILRRCPAAVRAQVGYCGTTLILSVAYTWKKKTGFGRFVSSVGKVFKSLVKATFAMATLNVKNFANHSWYALENTAMAFAEIVGIAMKAVEGLLVSLGVDASHASFIVKAVIVVVSIILAIPTGGASLSWPTLIASIAISVAAEVSSQIIASKMRKLERDRERFKEDYEKLVSQLNSEEDALTTALKSYDFSKFFDIGHSALSVGSDPILEMEDLGSTIGAMNSGPWVNWSTEKAINFKKYEMDKMKMKAIDINLVDQNNNQAAMSGE